MIFAQRDSTRNVRRGKRRARIERQKEIIHKAGFHGLAQLFAQLFRHRHLRKKKCAGQMRVAAIPFIRASAIESPIPARKYQYVAHPQFAGGSQQYARQIQMLRQTKNQQGQRRGKCERRNYKS